MIEGRMKKFYKEVVLVEQPFVMDPDMTVGKFLKQSVRRTEGLCPLSPLVRAIDKGDDDFAAEVEALSKGG